MKSNSWPIPSCSNSSLVNVVVYRVYKRYTELLTRNVNNQVYLKKRIYIWCYQRKWIFFFIKPYMKCADCDKYRIRSLLNEKFVNLFARIHWKWNIITECYDIITIYFQNFCLGFHLLLIQCSYLSSNYYPIVGNFIPKSLKL